MPVAVIADIHGNLPALEAVIADARQAGVERFLVAGDLLTRARSMLCSIGSRTAQAGTGRPPSVMSIMTAGASRLLTAGVG